MTKDIEAKAELLAKAAAVLGSLGLESDAAAILRDLRNAYSDLLGAEPVELIVYVDKPVHWESIAHACETQRELLAAHLGTADRSTFIDGKREAYTAMAAHFRSLDPNHSFHDETFSPRVPHSNS